MLPEEVIADVVRNVFPRMEVTYYSDNAPMRWVYTMRIKGDAVWSLTALLTWVEVESDTKKAARMLVTAIKERLEADVSSQKINLQATGSAAPFAKAALNLTPPGPLGYTRDGWYDTDKRRLDEARLIELMAAKKAHEEEEAAKASILDSLARKTRNQVAQGR